MEGAVVVKRHLTAVRRNKQSMPLRVAMENGFLGDRRASVLDYGCGRGDDIEYLTQAGYKRVTGYDPYFRLDDQESLKKASYTLLVYVLCVIEDKDERRFVLRRAWSLTKKRMLVAVRPPDFKLLNRYQTDPLNFEVYTARKTFQKFWTPSGLVAFINDCLGDVPIKRVNDFIYIIG